MMNLTGRERFIRTLNHQNPGKVVVDLGSTAITGIHVSALNDLRNALRLEKHLPVVEDPLQMLGHVDEDLNLAVGGDVVGISNNYTIFGFRNEKWQKFTFRTGLEMLVSGYFNPTSDADGNLYLYPQGDNSVPPCARMPKSGFFFDNITRSDAKADDDDLDARRDFKDDFGILTDDQLRFIEESVRYYTNETDFGLIYNGALLSIGDFAVIPGPSVKDPRGIRDLPEFMMAHYLNPSYVHEIFEMHLEAALQNARLLYEACGNKIQAVYISGTDFGLQRGPYMAPECFREFYKPVYKKLNDWIHRNTTWKTFFHSCGSVVDFLPDFYECGVDILNPVQTTAAGMDPAYLKANWGDKFVFWGGGINTQKTLPFATPRECYEETLQNLKIFAPGGGYVFNTVHNIQAGTPVENILAMYQAVKDYNQK